GLSLQEQESAGRTPIVMGLAVVFVFLFLAALYESWAVPFSVLLAVPIGLILLIGLSAKNAILIVEFAKVRLDEGMDAAQAALAAAKLRLRPILMTSFAFILGVLPLALATGAGAAARNSVGTAVAGGMVASTILSVVFIPVLYVIIRTLVPGRRRTHDTAPAPAEGAASA